jgi:hypothetical protein
VQLVPFAPLKVVHCEMENGAPVTLEKVSELNLMFAASISRVSHSITQEITRNLQPKPPPPPFGGNITWSPVQVLKYTACVVFTNVRPLPDTRSMVSKVSLYCPMLPIATPRPPMNRLLVIEMSVLLALQEMLSSPLMTVKLEKEMCEEKKVSAPSVFAGFG